MATHTLADKVVLIAGGAKNLGGLIARDLASHGAKAVAIHYNSAASQAQADETAAAVRWIRGAIEGAATTPPSTQILIHTRYNCGP